MSIEYSIVIRTIGKAGEIYQTMLSCIERLEPQPREVIVVLPEGYDLPQEKLGFEKFVFSPKGMVEQRIYGIERCTSEYVLVCDDDLAFPEDFVRKLHQPLEEGIAEISVGPLLSFLPPAQGLNKYVAFLSASAAFTLFNKDKYIKILRSSGWSYNRNVTAAKHRYYHTDSAAWTCFFGRTQSLININMREEQWLDRYGYASLDDQTMFYKALKLGIKTVVVPDALYEHLDAKTSVKNKQRKIEFSMGFNRVVFWHRFIYGTEKHWAAKLLDIVAFRYYLAVQSLYNCFRQDRERRRLYKSGIKEGRKYLKSEEYRPFSMPD